MFNYIFKIGKILEARQWSWLMEISQSSPNV